MNIILLLHPEVPILFLFYFFSSTHQKKTDAIGKDCLKKNLLSIPQEKISKRLGGIIGQRQDRYPYCSAFSSRCLHFIFIFIFLKNSHKKTDALGKDCLKKNLNASRPFEHSKTFRWYNKLQIQNLFMPFKRIPRW